MGRARTPARGGPGPPPRPGTDPPPRTPPGERSARPPPTRAAHRPRRSPAGSRAGTPPTSPSRARRPHNSRRGLWPDSEVQIPLDEIVLLQPAQALADLTRPHRPDAGDRLEISLGRADDRVQVAQVADDLLDDRVGKPGDPREDPKASRSNAVVERIDLARVPEQFGEALGLEQLLVGQRMQPLERELGTRTRSIGVIVVDDKCALCRNLADELVELHPD